VSSTPVALRRFDGPPSGRAAPPGAALEIGPTAIRLVTFGALSLYAAASWLTLVADPPRGRAALAVLLVVAGAAGLAWLAGRVPRPALWGAGLAVAIVSTAAACVAIGLPARLLVPGNWDELANRLSGGLQGLGELTYPYRGGAEWSRLTILLGLPLGLGLAAGLAFWPARRRAPRLRIAALVLIVAAYAVGATVNPAGAPLVHGLVLLLLVSAWLWLPGLGARQSLDAAAVVLAAGALSLPVAAQLDGDHPWLDYRDWSWSWTAVDGGESFEWDHSYAPLDWTRTGKTLFEVRSDAPHYWRTVVLDRFDGYRWTQSTASGNGAVELPRSRTSSPFTPQTVALDPDWIHRLTFAIRGLRSQLVVGAGFPIGIGGLDGLAPIQGGVAMPSDRPLTDGDTYTMRAYIPDPSASQMRREGAPYPHALAPYTLVVLPSARTIAPGTGGGSPNQNSTPSTRVTFHEVSVPFFDAAGRRTPDRILATSAYRGVYRLARRVTAGAAGTYEAVERIETYLRSSYTYSEIPPPRKLALRAFLLRDGVGYCQQFSGAMALMLRMIGIPARVASGFTPGTSGGPGTYVVRDFDAHSWVEVYFNDIGWVPFDPTPSAAPARSQATGLGARVGPLPPTGRPLPPQPGGDLTLRRHAQPGADSSPSPLWLLALVAVALALAGGLALGARALRSRSLSPGELADAQLRELDSALARLRSPAAGGTTLLVLERRLALVGGPASSGYAAKLREARYAPGHRQPPTAAERGRLRRELTAGLGMSGRLRGLLAIPPGGPTPPRRSA
jgi:transglutaminase-like putative cysteine protease